MTLRELNSVKKGDVLLWHANLIHGSEILNPKLTRRAPCHFCKDVIRYHEITQRRQLFHEFLSL